MYFHCFVKVCPIANESTCSLSTVGTWFIIVWQSFKVTGTTNTCSASGVSDPTRRRRDTTNQTNPIDIVGPAIQGWFSKERDFNKENTLKTMIKAKWSQQSIVEKPIEQILFAWKQKRQCRTQFYSLLNSSFFYWFFYSEVYSFISRIIVFTPEIRIINVQLLV